MIKFSLAFINLSIAFFSLTQNSAENETVYHYKADKLKFKDTYIYDSLCEVELNDISWIIVDSNGLEINGWCINYTKKYVIVRHIANGLQDGAQYEYEKTANGFILESYSFYENGNISFLAFFDSEKLGKNGNLVESLKSYRVWYKESESSELVSKEIKIKGKNKQTQIEYSFNREFHRARKRKRKTSLNKDEIQCHFDAYVKKNKTKLESYILQDVFFDRE